MANSETEMRPEGHIDNKSSTLHLPLARGLFSAFVVVVVVVCKRPSHFVVSSIFEIVMQSKEKKGYAYASILVLASA